MQEKGFKECSWYVKPILLLFSASVNALNALAISDFRSVQTLVADNFSDTRIISIVMPLKLHLVETQCRKLR